MIQKADLLIPLALLASACASLAPQPKSIPSQTTTFTPKPTVTFASTPTCTPSSEATPSPTMCTGWMCTLGGVVYANKAESGQELEGVMVRLSQFSYCSPTSGQHETITDPEGIFEFDLYIHDTDKFLIEVELDGYKPASQSLGGFDCLYCNCPPIEIIL